MITAPTHTLSLSGAFSLSLPPPTSWRKSRICLRLAQIAHMHNPEPTIVTNGVLAIYCCVTNYTPKLSSLKEHAFIISKFQWVKDPSKAWQGPPAQGLPQAAVKVLARAQVISRFREQDPLPESPSGAGRIQFLSGQLGWGPCFFIGHQAEATHYSLLHRPLLRAVHNRAGFIRTSKRERDRWNSQSSILILEVTSHQFCHSLFISSRFWASSHSRGRNYTEWIPGVGDHGSHSRSSYHKG